MVVPQSPLHNMRSCIYSLRCYEPEEGCNIVPAIRCLLVFLWSSLEDLESILAVEGVGRIGRSGDFATVITMAKDLYFLLASSKLVGITTYLGFHVALHLIADVAAHTSSSRHVDCDVG